ncbi:hypothetical protein EIP91_008088 [Steccherinum ochraceum]|uniref:MYND-type domain-containing protein n=1 Tax=Steccherinum ochraceum TaxID=92696 RepID=A0A4R0RQ87_9APHY|nr:hypothetical protein EIP91_008088 [Steccherinum ochraceum]
MVYYVTSVGLGESGLEPMKQEVVLAQWERTQLPKLDVVRHEVVLFRQQWDYSRLLQAEGPERDTMFANMASMLEVTQWASMSLMDEVMVIQTIISHFADSHYGQPEWMAILGLRKEDTEDEQLKWLLKTEIKRRLVHCCMREDINRLESALRMLEKTMIRALDEELEELESPNRETPWREELGLLIYTLYADALVFANRFDEHTKSILDGILETVEKSGSLKSPDTAMQVKVHLALVLEQMDVEPERQKAYTDLMAEHFRRVPSYFKIMRCIIKRPAGPEHPVARALGPEFFTRDRRTTRKEDRQMKVLYYCSKTCQIDHWPSHRAECKIYAKDREEHESLKQMYPKEARRRRDNDKWIQGAQYAIFRGPINALALHRDPSRGRTHVVFLELVYKPKLEDVWEDLDRILQQPAGRAKAKVEKSIASVPAEDDPSTSQPEVPMFMLIYGEEIDTFFRSVSVRRNHLSAFFHNPKWRDFMNPTDEPPPERLVLPSGARDAELDLNDD